MGSVKSPGKRLPLFCWGCIPYGNTIHPWHSTPLCHTYDAHVQHASIAPSSQCPCGSLPTSPAPASCRPCSASPCPHVPVPAALRQLRIAVRRIQGEAGALPQVRHMVGQHGSRHLREGVLPSVQLPHRHTKGVTAHSSSGGGGNSSSSRVCEQMFAGQVGRSCTADGSTVELRPTTPT